MGHLHLGSFLVCLQSHNEKIINCFQVPPYHLPESGRILFINHQVFFLLSQHFNLLIFIHCHHFWNAGIKNRFPKIECFLRQVIEVAQIIIRIRVILIVPLQFIRFLIFLRCLFNHFYHLLHSLSGFFASLVCLQGRLILRRLNKTFDNFLLALPGSFRN